jgi:hypothetical protein
MKRFAILGARGCGRGVLPLAAGRAMDRYSALAARAGGGVGS